ncbi:MAG: twin-arginine translocase TatA/TatE family subunit [SAR202 cluster bacterium]|nr:twin-arginine translocase TatA/TatE family subunit [SAR202 cluster bacterium]
MNFMGMGVPEIGVIMLVAFLVLGPSRSIDMARSAGKLLGDLRRTMDDVTKAVSVEAEQLGTTPTRRQEASVDTASSDTAPGVPMRPETPPEDADEPDEPVDTAASSENKG